MNKKELRFCDEICDMIATIIIQKQEEIKPDLDAKIWVTWVDRFFVVNGFTTLTNVFDTSAVVNEKLSQTYGEDWIPINIVDLIRYGENSKPQNRRFHYHRFNRDDDTLISDPRPVATAGVFRKPIISQDIFGQSIRYKNYYFLAAKIANHIYRANYTNDEITIDINSESQEIDIYIKGNSTVSIDFINNVVDACFAEKFQQEFDKMDLKNFDFFDYINQEMNYPWHRLDHMKDFMMI